MNRRLFLGLCAFGIAINAAGLFSGVMMIDGALYALIAKNMVVDNNYAFLTLHGFDWLDKPHFPFWCMALSYQLLGINAFAYKLPAFLFWLVGARYTYLLAGKVSGVTVGRLAVLVYLSALHLVLCNSAVNAEPYLTGMVIAAIYHFYRVYQQGELVQVVAGAAWAAAAVMTKGIFVLILIGGGFLILWLVRKEWKQLLNYRWYFAVALVLVFILPELYCLYLQFDARPNVEVFGQTGVSGIRFFFWDSQFGRFFNSGPIKGSGDPFFYMHTLLWAFLPWSIIFLVTVYFTVRKGAVNLGHPLLWGTVGIALALFSASSFQLPHYLNALFPLMAIWVAQFLAGLDRYAFGRLIHVSQWYLGMFLMVALVLLAFFFHASGWLVFCLMLAVLGVLTLYNTRTFSVGHTVGISYGVGLSIALFYGVYLYPELLKYQSGDAMAHYINSMPASDETCSHVMVLHEEINNFTLGFSCNIPLQAMRHGEQWETLPDGSLLAVSDERLREIPQSFQVETVAVFPGYRVSRLTPKFFHYKTRNEQLNGFHLVRLWREGTVTE